MAVLRFLREFRTFVALAVLAASFICVPAGAASPAVSLTPELFARAGTSDVAYVLTSCGKGHCLRLYRTDMRGLSFERVTLPPKIVLNGMVARVLNSLSFATPTDGYAFVGPYDQSVVYVTTNGARSWHQLRSLDDLVGGIHVTESGVFAMTAHCSLTTTNCTDYRVWRSTFDATTWAPLPTLWKAGTNGRYYSSPPDIAAFRDDVWELEAAQNGQVYLWTSINRGESFSRTLAPKLASVSGCSITPVSTMALWAECPTGMMVAFLHSNDAGAHWSSVSQSQFGGTAGGAFDPVTSAVAYLYYGAESVRSPNFVRLIRGGAMSISVDSLHCSIASALDFTSIRRGLLLCTNEATSEILVTSNGGVSWNKVTLPRG